MKSQRYLDDPDLPDDLRAVLSAAKSDGMRDRARVAAALGLGATTLDPRASTAPRPATSLVPRWLIVGGAVTLLVAVPSWYVGARSIARAPDARPSAVQPSAVQPWAVQPSDMQPSDVRPSDHPPSGPVAGRARESASAPTRSVEREMTPPVSVASVDVHALPSADQRGRAAIDDQDLLNRELDVLDAAREAIARGRGADALRHLDRHGALFPRAKLRDEATVLRIEALVARGGAGDLEKAAELAGGFLRSSPKTPYAARVRSAIARREGGVLP